MKDHVIISTLLWNYKIAWGFSSEKQCLFRPINQNKTHLLHLIRSGFLSSAHHFIDTRWFVHLMIPYSFYSSSRILELLSLHCDRFDCWISLLMFCLQTLYKTCVGVIGSTLSEDKHVVTENFACFDLLVGYFFIPFQFHNHANL